MKINEINDIYKALGDETRLRIVSLLLNGELCVCELESLLDLSQANASRHLNRLNSAGITSKRKRSQWVYYRIDDKFSETGSDILAHVKKQTGRAVELKKDHARLAEYRKSGLSCDELKLQKNKLFK
jgi:ArsR family transcriptional regulator